MPAFQGYNQRGNYAEFLYLNRDGQEDGAAAYRIATPFGFYHDLPTNRPPDEPPPLNEAAVSYFCNIFARWRDEFGFDFIRYDSTDHIFDSVVNGDPDFPASDRPTPAVLQRCALAAKTPDKPYIGNLAEHMGNEIEEYAGIGLDLILGTDMLDTVDRAHLEKGFAIYDHLTALNATRPTPFAVVYAIDTHDTDNPGLWGKSLIALEGSAGIRRRHFLARFLNCGLARRPKYEVVGLQDMSYGLYDANIRDRNVTWVGDAAHNQAYHLIEDIYRHFAAFSKQAVIVQRVVTDHYAWWVMQHGERCLARWSR